MLQRTFPAGFVAPLPRPAFWECHRPLLSASMVTITKALLLLSCLLRLASAAVAEPECNGRSMNIVAHEDDDLLFLSPDLIHDIQSGRCVRTIFVTAGDAGDADN